MTPVPRDAVLKNSVRKNKVPKNKKSRFAVNTPSGEFAAVCPCPACGWWDTHFLRAPKRPFAPKPAPQESWTDRIAGWFSDDKPTSFPPPMADHPDAVVERICRSCGQVWAQS